MPSDLTVARFEDVMAHTGTPDDARALLAYLDRLAASRWVQVPALSEYEQDPEGWRERQGRTIALGLEYERSSHVEFLEALYGGPLGMKLPYSGRHLTEPEVVWFANLYTGVSEDAAPIPRPRHIPRRVGRVKAWPFLLVGFLWWFAVAVLTMAPGFLTAMFAAVVAVWIWVLCTAPLRFPPRNRRRR